MKIKNLVLILFLFFVAEGYSQTDTIRISMAELEQKSLDDNLQLKMAQSETELSEAALLETRAMYLPVVDLSYSIMATNSPMMAFGFKLNQARIGMEDFDPQSLNHPNSILDFGTKIEVVQPIINMDAVYQKKAGEVKTDVYRLKEERTKEYILFEIKKSYGMLQLSYEMLDALENARNTVLANKKVVDNYYNNGLVQKSDVLFMDVRLTEIDNQIKFAKTNILNVSDYIFFLLGEDSEGKILKPTERLEYNNFLLADTPALDMNRKDIQAYTQSLEAYDWMMKSAKANFLPRLNAFGSFEFHNENPVKYNGNGYLVGLQLSWNVFDGHRSKSHSQKYQAEKDKVQAEIDQYTQSSGLELKKAYRAIEDADMKVSLTESAWDQSKEAYRISKNRYDQGLEKSSDILTAETLMSQKELEYRQAIFEYNTAVLYYQFLK